MVSGVQCFLPGTKPHGAPESMASALIFHAGDYWYLCPRPGVGEKVP